MTQPRVEPICGAGGAPFNEGALHPICPLILSTMLQCGLSLPTGRPESQVSECRGSWSGHPTLEEPESKTGVWHLGSVCFDCPGREPLAGSRDCVLASPPGTHTVGPHSTWARVAEPLGGPLRPRLPFLVGSMSHLDSLLTTLSAGPYF